MTPSYQNDVDDNDWGDQDEEVKECEENDAWGNYGVEADDMMLPMQGPALGRFRSVIDDVPIVIKEADI